jgi:hypothetical protein
MYAYISGVVLDGEGLAAVLEVLVAIASGQSVGERVVGVHLGDRLTHVVQHAEHARRALYIIVDAPTGYISAGKSIVTPTKWKMGRNVQWLR